MNSNLLGNTLRFVVLLLLQVLVFNNILLEFLGNVSPYPYIIFILLLPIQANKISLLTISFVFGLLLDMFGNSGGSHAGACLVLAFVRPFLLVSSFGISYEHQNLKFNDVGLRGVIVYVVIGCVLHHSGLFWLEVFNTSHFLFILKQTLLSTVFTSICVLLYFGLTQNKKV